MASYHSLLQHTTSRSESPAKVFAKLKHRVQRETKADVLTDKDPACNVREKHGADFNSPRKTTQGLWMTHDLVENDGFSSYGNEVHSLTISPISSPQKTFTFSATDSKRVSKRLPGHAPISRHGHTPATGAFLQSTAASYPVCVSHREQIHTGLSHVKDLGGSKVTCRTPLKTQAVQNDCVRSVFEEECAPQDKVMSPAKVYSPMRKRLRKRKWEQEFSVSSSTKGIRNEDTSQSLKRKISPLLTDNIHNGVSDVQGPIFPLPRSTAEKRCSAITEDFPVMSPAKMFAFMKERESKREQQQVHSSTRQLFTGGYFGPSRDTPLSAAQNLDKMENFAFTGVTENVVPAKQSRVETTDKQCSSSGDVLVPAVQSQAVFFEDPLVLNSPRISIPKKHQAVIKCKKSPHSEKFPDESVIYLKQWFLRKTQKGLFVDGIHRDENIPWNSNIIVDRVTNSVLKTVSGRVYILVGKMKLGIDSGFPKWFLKKFVSGFPPNWKMLYEKFILEARE